MTTLKTEYTRHLREGTVETYLSLIEATPKPTDQHYYFATLGSSLQGGLKVQHGSGYTQRLKDLLNGIVKSAYYINGLSHKNVDELFGLWRIHMLGGGEPLKDFYTYYYQSAGYNSNLEVDLGDEDGLHGILKIIHRMLQSHIKPVISPPPYTVNFSLFSYQVGFYVKPGEELVTLIKQYRVCMEHIERERHYIDTSDLGYGDKDVLHKGLDVYVQKIGQILLGALPTVTTLDELINLMVLTLGEVDCVKVNKLIYLIQRRLGTYLTLDTISKDGFDFLKKLTDERFEAWSTGPVIKGQDRVKGLLEQAHTNKQTLTTPILDSQPFIKGFIQELIGEYGKQSIYTLIDESKDEVYTRFYGTGEQGDMCPTQVVLNHTGVYTN